MVASVLVAKYGWHLPLYRQAKMLAAQGLDLDRSTLAFWVGYAAAELVPLYERLKANLLTSAKLAVDETAVPVLDPGRGQTKTGYFWVIARALGRHRSAGRGLYLYAGSRRRASRQTARRLSRHRGPRILWFTGLSGSGKSTIANLVEKALHERGIHTMLLDGDNMRHGLNRDLGFTEIDRVENIRRVGEVAKLFVEAGLVVLCCFISPFQAEHQLVRDLVSDGDFVEIFIDVPIDECIRRDPQGLYQRALAGNGLSLMPFPAVLDLSGLLTSCFQLTLQMAMFI